VLTLGVDLAANPKRTAVCEIHWADGKGEIRDARVGATDDELLDAFERADKVGIDAPFGWPDAFVESVTAYHEGKPWPRYATERLRLRETDLFVHEQTGIWPLSVSSNLIAVTAMRCALLLSLYEQRHGPVLRDGSGKLVEVYPAAALRVWRQEFAGYKGKANASKRAALVGWLQVTTTSWLRAGDEVWGPCQQTDHVFDALIASLVARLAAAGYCWKVPEGATGCSRREGWIAIPQQSTLSNLANQDIGAS